MSAPLTAFLSGDAESLDTLVWLQDEFLPSVVRRLNDSDSRKRLALYGGDRIPENERNLTDFRNRISLIVEYEFARAITEVLDVAGVDDQFCAYVVANRFPDLEIRSDEGERGLRFEVKCLQSTAEEKSANFSTLGKDIQPFTDFVIVFLWDWWDERTGIQWDRAPIILDNFVFNASSLAMLRDWYWLNRPPSNLGGGYQGIDIRYPVNCGRGAYNEEEGNFCNLLRLWQRDFQHRPPNSELLRKTENDYLDFKDTVVIRGFEILANQLLPTLSGRPIVTQMLERETVVGFKSGDVGFVAASRINGQPDFRRIMRRNELVNAWLLQHKYQWRHFRDIGGNIVQISEGKKPKFIL